MNQVNNQAINLDQFLETNLNTDQKQAVVPHKGILLVRAGAGSGKTRVITARIANLIQNHSVEPTEIIALTFTNKAAQEMRERVKQFLDNSSALPFVGTFHSYCLRFLKINSNLLPFSNFSILDDSDQLKIAKDIINQTQTAKKVTPYQLLSLISNIKNNFSFDNKYLDSVQPFFRELYQFYETKKNTAHCLDFDDLLVWTVKILHNCPDIRTNTQRFTKHILVDEYQDTNKIQHTLLKLLSLEDDKFSLDSLCVVGDEDQSIYSWRGAIVSNILNFNRDFENAKIITIEQNYRSVQPILETANSIIENNKLRNPKNLSSTKKAENRVQILECNSSKQEAEIIAQFLKQPNDQIKLKNTAILYRSHFQSRNIEEAFMRHSIPYQIIGGIQFYNRQEIKDIFAYLRLIVNPYDRVALSRAINTPTRGLGPKFEEIFNSIWDQQPFLDFRQVGKKLLDESAASGLKAQSFINFLDIFEELTPTSKASFAIETILKKTHYYNYIDSLEDNKENSQARKDNIKELINSVTYLEQTNDQNLEQFLQEVSLLQDQMHDKSQSSDCVKLMTLHAAKGLEFDTVIIIGCEEGILPSTRSFEQIESIEEERRLLYVGITRARERLLTTYTRYRFTYGQATDQRPSRFLAEFPSKVVNTYDARFWQEAQVKAHFNSWLNNTKQITQTLEPSRQLNHTSFSTTKINGKINSRITQEQAIQASSTNRSVTIKNGSLENNYLSGKNYSQNLNNTNLGNQNLNSKNLSNWRLYQTVQHENFGLGVIQNIETKKDKIYLSIRFNAGLKKIESSFIK